MSTGDRSALSLPEQQAEVTTTSTTGRAHPARLNDSLRGLPNLDFSEKGLANICRRLGVSTDELAASEAAVQSPRPSQPTPELLLVIATAVATKRRTERRSGKC